MVGGGAREHAILWKLAKSPRVERLYAAPGNAGTALLASNLDIKPTDIRALIKATRENEIDLVVVGPEAPLAAGITDRFQENGIPIFGPTQSAATIESSKVFARHLMQKYQIPCAHGTSFSNYNRAKKHLLEQKLPVVIKADGLAAGKGVTVASSLSEADEALYQTMVDKIHGPAGDRVIIEECLTGKEMSAFAFTDGNTVVPIVPACDYKPVYDGNSGPNTGGMGSYSPPHFTSGELEQKITKAILEPAVDALARENRLYQGVLYAGLMITSEGPKVMEFNARFGDPETQAILPRLKTDLLNIFLATSRGNLDEIDVKWSGDSCVAVVMSSGGYPGSYHTGYPISGLENLESDVMVFHAGTRTGTKKGEILSDGGRVITVVGTGSNIARARERVYHNISHIHFEGCHYRKDIAMV
ncbi:MAG: phosphoribosylamine--glycine ligase [Dehalococcoidales bacterium]